MRYGAATAIDADGHSIDLLQESTANGFRIVVPENFVSLAALPLIIDPVLNTFSVTNDTRRQLDMDVAYEGNNSTYQIVYSEIQSGTDIDVMAASYNAPLDLLFPAVAIDDDAIACEGAVAFYGLGDDIEVVVDPVDLLPDHEVVVDRSDVVAFPSDVRVFGTDAADLELRSAHAGSGVPGAPPDRA